MVRHMGTGTLMRNKTLRMLDVGFISTVLLSMTPLSLSKPPYDNLVCCIPVHLLLKVPFQVAVDGKAIDFFVSNLLIAGN